MIIQKPPRFVLAMVCTGLLILATGCQIFSPTYTYKGTLLEPPKPLSDFELSDLHQQPFHLSDIKDNIILVYFGYTFCPDVCPLTLAHIRQALNDLEGRDRIKVVFISVDPEYR